MSSKGRVRHRRWALETLIVIEYIVEFLGFNWGFTYIAAMTVISLFPAFFIQ